MATQHCTHLGQRGSGSCVWIELSKELLHRTVELALHSSLGVLIRLRLSLILQLLQRPAKCIGCQASHAVTVVDDEMEETGNCLLGQRHHLHLACLSYISADCITHHAVHKRQIVAYHAPGKNLQRGVYIAVNQMQIPKSLYLGLAGTQRGHPFSHTKQAITSLLLY